MATTIVDEEARKTDGSSLRPRDKGGFRACMFVYVLATLENMGFVANSSSMVLYFYLKMHFDLSGSANTLTNFLGSAYLLSLVGGFISDTFLSKLKTILIFGSIETLALVMVTVQAYSEHLHPKPCGKSSCVKGGIAFMFYTSLSLLAIGYGTLRGVLPALGAHQFDPKDEKGAKGLASFFNWFLLSLTIGAVIGVTGIAWVSTNKGWYWGFFISTVAVSVGFVILASGKPFYRLQSPEKNPILRILQVIVVATKNHQLSVPDNPEELYEINDKEKVSSTEETLAHTNQFRVFDKAAILPTGTKPSPWTVCTVTQVEEVKIITRMLPILGSTIIMNTCLAQLQTFSVQQGNTMNLYIGSFKVPAPSIPVIPLIFLFILVPTYELIFIPLARKVTGHPSGITQLQRIGVGLVLSVVSMVVAGIVEVRRKHQAINNPLKPISLFWLSFQYAIIGIADMFTLVGLLDFFYTEAPAGMESLATSFSYLSLSLGYFLSSAFVDIINSITKRITPSKQGWLGGLDINKDNLDFFYYFLAILSTLNFLNYLYWATWYKYKIENLDIEPKRTVSRIPSLGRNETAHQDKENKIQETAT